MERHRLQSRWRVKTLMPLAKARNEYITAPPPRKMSNTERLCSWRKETDLHDIVVRMGELSWCGRSGSLEYVRLIYNLRVPASVYSTERGECGTTVAKTVARVSR